MHNRVIQSIGAVLLAVIVILALRLFIFPSVAQFGSDFVYAVNILSFDNFYDESKQVFTGEKRSVTTLRYTAKEDIEDYEVDTVFTVRTVTGEEIITIARTYGIDPITKQHVPGKGDADRNGYLFGPPSAQKDTVFSYWHVNYNIETTMRFDGEETINGLPLYKYTSEFIVDQTMDLQHLPGVPESRGVDVDVTLTLWIEPVSGWLVKYEDKAIAYYYDQATGERLHPWNTFRNMYTRASISEQVEHARSLKKVSIFMNVALPFLVGLFLLFGVVYLIPATNYAFVLLGIGTFGFCGYMITTYALFTHTPEKIPLVGIARWVAKDLAPYDENIRGFKEALSNAGYYEGHDVRYAEASANTNVESQKDIAHSFVQQDISLVYSLTTPGTIIMKEFITNRPIVFSIVTYPVEVGLIESINFSGNNLVGTRNWVPIQDQLALFLEIAPQTKRIGFIQRTGEVNSTIQFEKMKQAAETQDIEIVPISGRDFESLTVELASKSTSVDALYSACDTLVQGEVEDHIIAFAQSNRIPSFSCNESGPLKGDLIGMVADFYHIGKLAGEKAALILDGASPSSLETSTIARPLIYVNKKTADLLGVIIPQSILAKAHNIIR